MKKRIFAAMLIAAPLHTHAQPPATVDQPGMAKMGQHQQREGRAFGGHEGTPPFLRGTNLSEAQKDKIFELMQKQAPAMRDKAKASHQAMNELHELSLSNNYDEARAKKLARSAADAQSEMGLLRSQNDQKILAMLTPEQRKEVAAKAAGRTNSPR